METSIYDELFIAMEAGAEDITAEAADNASGATKGSGDYKPDMSNRGDMDTNTDDILGTKGEAEDNTGASGEEDSTDEPDAAGGDEDIPSDDTDTDSEDGETDDGSDTGMDETAPEESQTSKFEIDKKIALHHSMNEFYDIVIGNIETLSSYEPSDSSQETLKVINGVKDIFERMKTIIYNILAYQFKQYTYAELMKKFLTLTNAYDAAISGLESHFDSVIDAADKPSLRKKNIKKDPTADPSNNEKDDPSSPRNQVKKKQTNQKKKDTEA